MLEKPRLLYLFYENSCIDTATSSAHRVIGVKQTVLGRLGNDMFVYASVVGIAAKNKMVPVYMSEALERTFHVTGTGNDVISPPAVAVYEDSAYRYDRRFETLDKFLVDVTVVGYFQSWKYFRDMRSCILKEFTFRSHYQTTANNFLADVAIRHNLTSDAIYIGVHIRRRDMATDQKYTVANVRYFRRAVHYMTRKFPRRQLVFVVCSDELPWAKVNFSKAVSRVINHVTIDVRDKRKKSQVTNKTTTTTTAATTTAKSAVVVFSENYSAAEDLAILSSCDHTIMSVGTYGWWAGYLAGGTVVYYRNFPRKGGELMPQFSREDFFPPEWVGL